MIFMSAIYTAGRDYKFNYDPGNRDEFCSLFMREILVRSPR